MVIFGGIDRAYKRSFWYSLRLKVPKYHKFSLQNVQVCEKYVIFARESVRIKQQTIQIYKK